MILLIDNYDSFTYNLAHLIAASGQEILVRRNDALVLQDALDMSPDAIVLSPGPSVPDNAGISLDLVGAALERHLPVFGVCLGLQTIAQACGGKIVRAEKLMHGKTSAIEHQNAALFSNVSSPFTATRYHSLIADPKTLPSALKIIALSTDDHEIMAIEHESAPIAAVQFHPESIASEFGGAMFQNFLTWAETRS